MTVGIVGLGLIGGSLAKAYSLAGENVLAFDVDASTCALAQITEAVNGDLNENTIPTCDLILLCVYPQAAIEYMKIMPNFLIVILLLLTVVELSARLLRRAKKLQKNMALRL